MQRNFNATRPGQLISVDYVGKLSRTNNDNQHILCLIDCFSRHAKLYATKTQTTKETLEILNRYVNQYGIMENLLSDCGSCFKSESFKEAMKQLNITHLYTTPWRPQTNSLNETTHRHMKKGLTIFARQNLQWDKYLSEYMMHYNNTIHPATLEKPSYILFGRDIRTYDMVRQLDPEQNGENLNALPEYIKNEQKFTKTLRK